MLLYQAYAFVLPALTPRERKTILPFLLAGAVPVHRRRRLRLLRRRCRPRSTSSSTSTQDEFNVQIRARDYYSFFALTLVAVGLLFQVPIGILAVTRLGIVTPQQIAANRRYAILVDRRASRCCCPAPTR